MGEELKFELAHISTSMFEDSGNMRGVGGKSVIKGSNGRKTLHRLFGTTSIIPDDVQYFILFIGLVVDRLLILSSI